MKGKTSGREPAHIRKEVAVRDKEIAEQHNEEAKQRSMVIQMEIDKQKTYLNFRLGVIQTVVEKTLAAAFKSFRWEPKALAKKAVDLADAILDEIQERAIAEVKEEELKAEQQAREAAEEKIMAELEAKEQEAKEQEAKPEGEPVMDLATGEKVAEVPASPDGVTQIEVAR